MAEFLAHSLNDNGTERHLLDDHLRGTAELARRFADVFGGGEIAWWLGFLHDVGKASCEWQEKLLEVEGTGQAVGVPHKLLGTKLAYERGLGRLSMAVEGHHGGLTNWEAVRAKLNGVAGAEGKRHADALKNVRDLLPELQLPGHVAMPEEWRAPLVLEMALRLLFSALCDADALDTSAHFRGQESPRVGPDADFTALAKKFERRRGDFVGRRDPSPIDAIREEVYRDCVRAAALPRGIFRLGAPTGSGKTIATGGFAVHHAAAHGMRRVIVAVPFLTITEQNADVYRGLLGDDVLEHHSGVDFDQPRHRRGARLAAENWDAPFVVTTMVRLFESLFDRRPSAMRRLHRLAGSVIVLDEVQALPHQMLVPILDALRTLVDHFGATVVLSSATQPEFLHLSPFKDLHTTEIVPDPTGLAERLRRVEFEWNTDPGFELEDVAAEAADRTAALVVANTTADAKAVYEAWRGSVEEGVAWHLSTRMCGAHRRRVLAEVRRRLSAKPPMPVLLVSTQLIEAGVDVDFPVVYRVMAPADSLVQAAGRANREGNADGLGRVIIVDPSDAGRPPSYKALQTVTKVHFGPGKANPDSLEALGAYYRDVYDGLGLDGRKAVGQVIQQSRRNLDYQAVTDGPRDPMTDKADYRYAFRMIDNDGLTVVTPQGAADDAERATVEATIERIRTAPHPNSRDLRSLQRYMTTVHRSALNPSVLALMAPILGEPGQLGSLAEWRGPYDSATGISFDPGTEDFIC